MREPSQLQFFAARIIHQLEKAYPLSSIERLFELDQRSLSDWKMCPQKIPPEGVALLRIVNLKPELFLRLAENRYQDADKILVDEILTKPELAEQEKILNKPW